MSARKPPRPAAIYYVRTGRKWRRANHIVRGHNVELTSGNVVLYCDAAALRAARLEVTGTAATAQWAVAFAHALAPRLEGHPVRAEWAGETAVITLADVQEVDA